MQAKVGYLELIRTNPNYRRIWIGNVASLLGDWFNTIAIFTLVTGVTGSPLALGLVFLEAARASPADNSSPYGDLWGPMKRFRRALNHP
ncbi:MAG: hypothetical protein V3T81_09570 [Thermoanaerobaculia bacterium]